MSRPLAALSLLTLLAATACGSLAEPMADLGPSAPLRLAQDYRGEAHAGGQGAESIAAERGRAAGEAVVTPRLIRTGHVGIVVDAYEPFARELRAWLASAQGHVADANLQHSEGAVSHGSLTVRVPAESLDMLVGWVEEKVQVEQLTLTSSDVTAEWVDVQARIDNGLRAETRLQELLAENTGSLADVLAVERELARVRGQVESAEGRMRVLADQVGLSTLQVQVSVRTPYVAGIAPTFGDDAARTFSRSVTGAVAAARGLALAGVAVTPWVTPGLLITLLGLAVLRRRGERRVAR